MLVEKLISFHLSINYIQNIAWVFKSPCVYSQHKAKFLHKVSYPRSRARGRTRGNPGIGTTTDFWSVWPSYLASTNGHVSLSRESVLWDIYTGEPGGGIHGTFVTAQIPARLSRPTLVVICIIFASFLLNVLAGEWSCLLA